MHLFDDEKITQIYLEIVHAQTWEYLPAIEFTVGMYYSLQTEHEDEIHKLEDKTPKYTS